MAELLNDSTEQSHDAAAYAASLIHHYGFDLGGDLSGSDAIARLMLTWQEQYPAAWIRLATIEALYQGRYKAISVAQILALWQRRSQPIYHFNHEFERLICDRLPQALVPPTAPVQAESFSMRSAQAMMAHLQYPTVTLSSSNRQTTLPHHSDAMQTLRTLHAASAEPTPAASGAESNAASNESSLTQPHSYTVRSDTASAKLVSQAERLAQGLALGVSSDQLPLDPDVSLPIASDERLQADSIALIKPRSHHEQPHAITLPADSALPVSNDAEMTPATPQAAAIARILQQLDDQELSVKALFPGLGLLDQTLPPKLRLQLTARYQPIWLTDTSSKQPIHQFMPVPEASDFHTKLKSVAQVPEEMADGEPCKPQSEDEAVEG